MKCLNRKLVDLFDVCTANQSCFCIRSHTSIGRNKSQKFAQLVLKSLYKECEGGKFTVSTRIIIKSTCI